LHVCVCVCVCVCVQEARDLVGCLREDSARAERERSELRNKWEMEKKKVLWTCLVWLTERCVACWGGTSEI
jgi:hypothetical protein